MTFFSPVPSRFLLGRIERRARVALALGTTAPSVVALAAEAPPRDLHRAPAIPPVIDGVRFDAGN